jgi:alpha-D-ribose 1-methylphosphonate 5-triphosphate synthase subunit PhnH
LEKPGVAVRLTGRGNLPQPLNRASAALLAAWLNPETPVWTDLRWDSATADWMLHASGCSLVTEPCMARIAFIAEPLRIPPLDRFDFGEDGRPEGSATLIVQVPGFSGLNRKPGEPVSGSRRRPARPTGLPLRFWMDWGDQSRYLPFGIDVFFTSADTMMALPRGVKPA